MKGDGNQQCYARICTCKSPSSSFISYSVNRPLSADDQSPLSPNAAGNSRTICPKCYRIRAGAIPHRRLAPVPKSRGKAKGARKVRSCDVAFNHRLLSWRVVDRGVDGMVRAGVSASGIVGYLEGYLGEDDGDGYYDEEMEDGPVAASDHYGDVEMGCEMEDAEGEAEEEEATAAGIEADTGGGIGIGETDDMGFYQVGFVWDYVDDEDWCIVGEL